MSGEEKAQIVAPPQEDLPQFVTPADLKAARRRRRWRRCGKAGGWLIALAAVVAVAITVLLDKRLDAPGWVRAVAEERIEEQLGGLQIEFGEIQLVVRRGWRPRVSLRDVTVFYPDGTPAMRLEDAQAALAMRPLLRGHVRPKTISLTGLFATLQRNSGGAVALSFSDGGTPFREASNLPQLIDAWDRHLELPILSALTRVETQAVTLRYEDLRIGKAWTLDGGTVQLARNGNSIGIEAGFSILSGREYASTVEATYRSDIGDTGAEFAVVVDQVASSDIASQSPAFGWLDVLRAPISGSLRGAVDSDGALMPLTASLEIGTGVIQPNEALKPVPIRSARSFFTFDPAQQELEFSNLSVDSGWVTGQMEGRAELVGVRDGRLTELVGQLRFSDLKVNPLRLYPEPLSFAGVSADFRMELSPFRLRLGEMLIQREETDILISGEVRAGEVSWDYDLEGAADRFDVDMVKALWPPSAPTKPRQWFIDNVSSGEIRDAQVALRSRNGERPFLALDLGFENGAVKFNKFYPLLERAKGQLSIYGTRLVATATEGWLQPEQGGDVDLGGSSFIIPDTSLKDGNSIGILRAQASGSARAALALLNRAPLRILDKAGLPVDLGSGEVTVTATASMPLRDKLEISEVDYHYSGSLTAVESDVLVPGYGLASDRLELSGDNTHVEISGPGFIGGLPVTAHWSQALGAGGDGAKPGRVTGQIELSDRTIDVFRIGLPEGAVSGEGLADFEVTLPPGAPVRLRVNSDLEGVGLWVAELGWRKAASTTGSLSFAAELDDTPTIEDLSLEANGLALSGRVILNPDGGFDQAQFSSVSLGGWLQGPVTLTGRGEAAPAIAMSGGRVDLRKAPFSSSDGAGGSAGGGSGGNTPITLALAELQVTDDIALSRFEGRFDTRGGFNGSFTGNLNTLTPVEGVVVPQDGGMAMRVKSQDAGGVFRSAGVMRHGFGGSFEMTMVPSQTAGEYNGQVLVKNIRIKRAPAIAALINSLSLVGLFDELSGQGILFTAVEADFRLGPRYLTVNSGSAVGPSIGLSLDGIYDLSTSNMNMRGVLSPIYLVNAIGSVLTRKGEGLFGFSFTLKGTADDPKVSVNPLSGIAPGFLREIFRGAQPTAPGEEPEQIATPEEQREERRLRNENR
ncbi:AsmA-like C-terminal region-containing protein [Phaeobacter sp. B1627]|uniref:YhdP family protein n=1 Tax=Phaeobacter sp. B1627 TaxID=2583809 RepID=UPI0011181D01|nr:AsmA-like C-terminal region-containing protein [Phaeobacter sp. B1627]TNJ46748.1 DUF3971 domain-containing protein [Phaeobacter sp. B1627]